MGHWEVEILAIVTFEQRPKVREQTAWTPGSRMFQTEQLVQRLWCQARAWHAGRTETPVWLQQTEGKKRALKWCSAKWGSPTPVLRRPLCFLLSLRPSLFVPQCLYICLCLTKRDIFLSSESLALDTFRWKMKWVNGTCPFFLIHTFNLFFMSKILLGNPPQTLPIQRSFNFNLPHSSAWKGPSSKKEIW